MYTLVKRVWGEGVQQQEKTESVVAFEFCAIHEILTMLRMNTRANFSE